MSEEPVVPFIVWEVSLADVWSPLDDNISTITEHEYQQYLKLSPELQRSCNTITIRINRGVRDINFDSMTRTDHDHYGVVRNIRRTTYFEPRWYYQDWAWSQYSTTEQVDVSANPFISRLYYEGLGIDRPPEALPPPPPSEQHPPAPPPAEQPATPPNKSFFKKISSLLSSPEQPSAPPASPPTPSRPPILLTPTQQIELLYQYWVNSMTLESSLSPPPFEHNVLTVSQSQQYHLDFFTLTQRSMEFGTIRPIQRFPSAISTKTLNRGKFFDHFNTNPAIVPGVTLDIAISDLVAVHTANETKALLVQELKELSSTGTKLTPTSSTTSTTPTSSTTSADGTTASSATTTASATPADQSQAHAPTATTSSTTTDPILPLDADSQGVVDLIEPMLLQNVAQGASLHASLSQFLHTMKNAPDVAKKIAEYYSTENTGVNKIFHNFQQASERLVQKHKVTEAEIAFVDALLQDVITNPPPNSNTAQLTPQQVKKMHHGLSTLDYTILREFSKLPKDLTKPFHNITFVTPPLDNFPTKDTFLHNPPYINTEEYINCLRTAQTATASSNTESASTPDISQLVQCCDFDCSICLLPLPDDEKLFPADPNLAPQIELAENSIIRLPCDHFFHFECLSLQFNTNSGTKGSCPVCKYAYLIQPGPQPNATLIMQYNAKPCLGYENYPTIVMAFHLEGGIQDQRHHNPGRGFYSDTRSHLLPACPAHTGQPDPHANTTLVEIPATMPESLVKLYIKAFLMRHLFIIGYSPTRDLEDVITYGSIHVKSSYGKGAYGYPDPEYEARARSDIKAVGVSLTTFEKDI